MPQPREYRALSLQPEEKVTAPVFIPSEVKDKEDEEGAGSSNDRQQHEEDVQLTRSEEESEEDGSKTPCSANSENLNELDSEFYTPMLYNTAVQQNLVGVTQCRQPITSEELETT